MDTLLTLLFIIFFLALLIGLPIFIFLYKKLYKTKFKKYAFVVPVLITALVTYLIYDALYPSDGFYLDDFKEITQIDFPKSGSILSKDADYPDIHGHYTSVAVVELSSEDYRKLLNQVNVDRTFKTDTIIGVSDVYENVAKGIEKTEIKKIVRKGKIVVGFLNDNKRIIIERRLSDTH